MLLGLEFPLGFSESSPVLLELRVIFDPGDVEDPIEHVPEVGIDLGEIKGVYFVREFGDSESLTRKTFTSRPRSEGLWVRLRFKDSEVLEGLMPADLLQSTPEGFLVNPPDQRSNTQRIFVPRTALESLTVLAVIGAARRPRRGPTEDQRQVPMFEE